MSGENERTLPRCANCDIVIEWGPTIVGDRQFCCPGCARGGPCSCDYANLPQEPIYLDEKTAGQWQAASKTRRR